MRWDLLVKKSCRQSLLSIRSYGEISLPICRWWLVGALTVRKMALCGLRDMIQERRKKGLIIGHQRYVVVIVNSSL